MDWLSRHRTDTHATAEDASRLQRERLLVKDREGISPTSYQQDKGSMATVYVSCLTG